MTNDIKGIETKRDRTGHGTGDSIMHHIEFDAPVWRAEVLEWLKEKQWLGYNPAGYWTDPRTKGVACEESTAFDGPSSHWIYKHSASCD